MVPLAGIEPALLAEFDFELGRDGVSLIGVAAAVSVSDTSGLATVAALLNLTSNGGGECWGAYD